MTKILVTGATGNIGRQVAEALLREKASVRVAVRDANKAQALEEKGAEVVTYDIEKDVGVDAAFDGVQAAFIMTPFVPGFEALTQKALDAAKRAGVAHVVKLSAWGADPAAEQWLSKSHGLGDAAVAASGLSYTILRPTFFQDNVLNYAASTIVQSGAFFGAAAGQKSSFVSSADVAEVATTTLLNPSVHNSKTYELTGGEALTGAEVAQLMTAIGGKTITYTDLPPDQYAEGARSSGMPEPYVEAFLGLEAAKAAGYAASVSSHVQDVLKRPPEAYEAFLKRHKARIPVPGSA